MIRCMIIDDERLARQEMRKLLDSYLQIEIVDEAQNADEAIEKIHKSKPDLIFLDIQMPGKNGFELLSELEYTPAVIFVTAYDEYALNAFEINALDYVLKPVDETRLQKAISKLQDKIIEKHKTASPELEINEEVSHRKRPSFCERW
jgi:two-component system, LytTR family, response regulator